VSQWDEREQARYDGLYGRLDLLGAAFGTQPAVGCDSGASCKGSGVYGAWAGLRVGYAFGYFGVEAAGVVLGSFSMARESANSTSASSLLQSAINQFESRTYLHYSGGALLGVGPRFTTKGTNARFSFGVTPGIVHRTVGTRVQSGMNTTLVTTSYRDFGVTADAGFELGGTPGLRLYVGVQAWLDFPGRSAHLTQRGTALALSEQQLYVGPTLGFAFGH
jgi:hypothetical protein